MPDEEDRDETEETQKLTHFMAMDVPSFYVAI